MMRQSQSCRKQGNCEPGRESSKSKPRGEKKLDVFEKYKQGQGMSGEIVEDKKKKKETILSL